MKIRVITVGKIKEKYWKDAIAEYQKRLKPYVRLDIVEVLEEEAPENISDAQRLQIVGKESKRILSKIGDNSFVIALDKDGEFLDSLDFSKLIQDKGMMDGKDIVLIIGGSFGLSVELKSIAHQLFSFGRITYPHQLMRVILMEQIYRAIKISRNEPYHK